MLAVCAYCQTKLNLKNMLELLKYTLSGFWIFCGSYCLIAMILYFVVNGIVRIFSRFFRMIMVSFKGWPPSHLDADGDWFQKSDSAS
jgi:uncharacterized membrane protein HdeD (DUF308 family)